MLLPALWPPCAPISGTEDSTLLEVEGKAYRRLGRRHRYRPPCNGGAHPGLVTAAPAPRVIPKSILGVSVRVSVRLDKYLFCRPTYRLLADLQTHGLDLSLGSVTDGLQRLLPLFEPVYEALAEPSRLQPLWHAAETRWQVFATVEGKVGLRWYLGVFHAAEVVVFVLAQGRAHEVPEDCLGPEAEGILVVDRYQAYQAIDQVKQGLIVLAFCRAHVRRDFLSVARSWPEQEDWALARVARLGELYWYGLRTWIEQGFKRLKSGGWDWQYTRRTDPERAERLWLVMAVASWWCLRVGGEAETQEALPVETIGPLPEPVLKPPRPPRAAAEPSRQKSVPPVERVRPVREVCIFVRGRAAIINTLLCEGRLRLGQTLPEPWPTQTPAARARASPAA